MSPLAVALVALVALVVVAVVQRYVFARRVRTLTARLEQLRASEATEQAVHPDLLPPLRAAERLSDDLDLVKRSAREREELLGRALEVAPMAMVLFSDLGRISLANEAARTLFFEGTDPSGHDFLSMVGRAPDALRRALASDGDELFEIDDLDGERQTYHLSRRRFPLGGEPHVLVLVKNLTREIHRQEADVWRRMIRVFSHELNNSLAPVSSLLHSAEIVAAGSPLEPKLTGLFGTIRERTTHLRTFLDGYARFARLPLPRKTEVPWRPLFARVSALWPALAIEGELPTSPGWFDEAQIEQVLINLVKNAVEAGGAEVRADVSAEVLALADGSARISIRDRGPGMSEEVMRNALVPFYSTKDGGSGLGLPLCREIVDAHGGGMRIEAREGGGLCVRFRLPGRTTSTNDTRLTLTRS